jgi:hypothetical protein
MSSCTSWWDAYILTTFKCVGILSKRQFCKYSSRLATLKRHPLAILYQFATVRKRQKKIIHLCKEISNLQTLFCTPSNTFVTY